MTAEVDRINCFVCSKPIARDSKPYNDSGWTDYGIFHGLRVFHCEYCGFGFSYPELPREVVGSFYERQYRAKHSTFYIDFTKPVTRGVGDVSNSRALAQLTLARAHCVFNPEDVFLDIGPGVGGSFKLAKALLPRPQLCGIELSDGISEFYRKNYGAITYRSVDDFIATGKKAKFLLMSHSLEHYRLSDLAELFPILWAALAQGGVLIIEVPHADLRIHSAVRGVDTPHFLFFSKESLAFVLDKFGFEVCFLDACGEEYGTDEQRAIERAQSSKIRKYLKTPYNKLPMQLKIVLRIFARRLQRARSFTLTSGKSTSLPIHSYGGNRNCIRVVAKRK